MIPHISYLFATIVKPLSRGATAFSPAYASVPLTTVTGFPFRTRFRAPALTPTLMNLNVMGGAAGPVFVPTAAGQPLTANPYATS